MCERTSYDEEALTEAADRLRSAAGRIAAWHPANATAPPYTVGAVVLGVRSRSAANGTVDHPNGDR